MMAATPELIPCKRLADADALWCEECASIIWTISHPYWGAGQVRALHERGTGHRPLPMALALPEPLPEPEPLPGH